MKKILPSEEISKEIAELLSKGYDTGEENILSLLMKKSAEKIIQEALEGEVRDFLGRDHYSRQEGYRKGYRNGYEKKRLKSAEGELFVKAPQVRDTEEKFRSEILSEIGRISSELERLTTEMYVRGLSTRDIESTFKNSEGKNLLSKDAVSEMTENIYEEYTRFISRDLSSYDFIYMFFDAVYEKFRKEKSRGEAILCCWGITSSGSKHLIHMAVGNKESTACWQDFMRNMLKRGLREPMLVTSDGSLGLIRAIDETFECSKRQRCLFHKLKNIAGKLSEKGLEELMPEIKNCLYQTKQEYARQIAEKIILDYADTYPSAIQCFQEDFEQCITYMEFPNGHHKFIRTTNLLERSFLEQRRRTKTIPRFMDEKSCLKLTYGILIRTAERWKKVKMSDVDLALLKKARILFGWKENEDGYFSRKIKGTAA